MNIGVLAFEGMEKFGVKDSVTFEGRTFTNKEMFERAGKLAAVLRSHGVGPGDHALLMMLNCPDVLAAFGGVWRIGAVIVPVTPMLTAAEVRFLIENSEAKVAVTSPELAQRVSEASQGISGFQELLVIGECGVEGAVNIEPEIEAAAPVEELAERADEDLALLLYTSGTTGKPKGVMLTHDNLLSNIRSVSKFSNATPTTRGLLVLPLSHSFGVLMMNLGAALGTSGVILPRWDTRAVFEAIEKYRVERMAVVPTMLSYMINFPDREKYDYSSLEMVNTGGAALINEIRLEFQSVFGCRVKEGYGLSETAPTLTGYHDEEEYRPGSVGHAIDGVSIVILDNDNNPVAQGGQGEICSRGPNIMKGYWKLPDATREAMAGGWFHTGDIGYMDEDGYVYITDRKKDLIIKGGENISPRELEEALHEHEAVAESAVVGVPDPMFGENLAAVVVLRQGRTASEEELIEHLSRHVTKFKLPSRVVYMDELPKNPTGKIQKRAIREMVIEQMGDEAKR